MKSLFAIMTLLLNFQSPAQADEFPSSEISALDAATKALATLPTMSKEALKFIGFGERGESQAVLGEPYEVYQAHSYTVSRTRKTASPKTILSKESKTVFPIYVFGELRSSVTIVKHGNVWQTTSMGAGNLAKMVEDTRVSIRSKQRSKATKPYVVESRDLDLLLLGYDDDGPDVTFVPAMQHKALGLQVNIPVRGQELLPSLVDAAKSKEASALP